MCKSASSHSPALWKRKSSYSVAQESGGKSQHGKEGRRLDLLEETAVSPSTKKAASKNAAADNSQLTKSLNYRWALIDDGRRRPSVKPKHLFTMALLVAVVMNVFLYRRYRLMFRVQSDQEQSLSMFSESAFYYSFYHDLLAADSMGEGLRRLIQDSRSEHPDTLNALRRFNVYQELVLGMVWRLVPSWLMWFRSPWNFYAAVVFTHVSIGVGALAAIAAYVGGSVWCGVSTFGFFLGNFVQRLILRTSSVPLRENWGTPLLWIQIGLIVLILRTWSSSSSSSRRFSGGGSGESAENSFAATRLPLLLFAVVTFALVIVWQFSVFILTTQAACLFLLLLVGYPIRPVVTRLFEIYAAVFAAACVVQFFPRYLIFSFFPQVVISVLVVLYLWAPLSWNSPQGGQGAFPYATNLQHMLLHNFFRGVVGLLVCAFLRVLLQTFEKDDSHVFQMLLTKFGLAEHNFDSKIYLMGGTEFGFFPKFMLDLMMPSKVVFLAAFMALMYVTCCAADVWWIRSMATSLLACPPMALQSPVENAAAGSLAKKEDPASPTENPAVMVRLHPEVCFLVLQTLAFLALMCLIARLRVLELPLMCVLAGTIGSPYLWSVAYEFLLALFSWVLSDSDSKQGSKRLGDAAVEALQLLARPGRKSRWKRSLQAFWAFSMAVLPFSLNFPWKEMEAVPTPEDAAGSSKKMVIQWMNDNLPPRAGVLADMPMSAAIRVASDFGTVVNPQYEDVKLRQRVQFLYATSACPPLDDYSRVLHANYSTDYMLLSVYRCAAPRDTSAVNVWDVARMTDEKRYHCSDNVNVFQRFCWRVQFENSAFEMVYRNAEYAVFRRKEDSSEPWVPYAEFDGQSKLRNVTTWEPWIQRCIKTDPRCGTNIAGFARQLLDMYQQPDASRMLYRRLLQLYPNDPDVLFHYAEYLDFDLNEPREAQPFYEDAMRRKKDIDLRYLVDYSLFVDQVKGRKEHYKEVGDTLMKTLTFLERSDFELDADVKQLCRAAAQLLQLSKSSGTSDERNRWRAASSRLWDRARRLNVQAQCVTDEWDAFYGHNKTEGDILRHFLFWR